MNSGLNCVAVGYGGHATRCHGVWPNIWLVLLGVYQGGPLARKHCCKRSGRDHSGERRMSEFDSADKGTIEASYARRIAMCVPEFVATTCFPRFSYALAI